jgi:hypothetical protein
MRTLRIESGGRVIIDGEFADISQLENKGEFLASILTLDLELSEDISVYDIIHFFYDSKDLIKNILSEEYEVVRALVTTANLPRNYKQLRVYKSFKIESEIDDSNEEFIYMIPDIELVPCAPGEDGIRSISGLPVVIDENITLKHDKTGLEISSKTKITLFDLMTCLFEDLAAMLKDGAFLS